MKVQRMSKAPLIRYLYGFKQKYGETFSNDLPPRSSSLDNVPVKQETQIQENARLPWFQLFPEDLEQVHRNFARNAINDQKFLFPYR